MGLLNAKIVPGGASGGCQTLPGGVGGEEEKKKKGTGIPEAIKAHIIALATAAAVKASQRISPASQSRTGGHSPGLDENHTLTHLLTQKSMQ